MSQTPAHFENKDAIEHVIEKQAEGIANLAESHGTEMPGHFSALADGMRETALVFLLLVSIIHEVSLDFYLALKILSVFAVGWCVWKGCRSAWLGWARIERLHRVIEQEKFEIENHRPQERAELAALYRAKGFEGKLLEDVIDVLMADGDRLLKVMLEEELGLKLEVYEHPLKQAVGALIGSLISAALVISAYFLTSFLGLAITALLLMGGGALIAAAYEKNKIIHAVVWNMAIGGLSFGIVYFLLELLL